MKTQRTTFWCSLKTVIVLHWQDGAHSMRFSVDSKSFRIEEVGDGSKTKVIITERRWGRMSWIRFGEEGARTLLKSVVSLRKEADKNFEGWGL